MEKLYSRTSNGATQTWYIEVIGDSYITHEGLLDGKITTSKPTICLGKNQGKANETSAQEQAEKEAKALWKKKLDSGYQTDITKIDEQKFFEPMLAHSYGDYDTVYPVGSQPKLDGMRCVISKTGMSSRNGKDIVSCPHIFQAFAPVFAKYPDFIFDGELYTHKLHDNFNKIISLTKKTKPTAQDLEESAKYIQYHCYDFPSNKEYFAKRSETLGKLIKALNKDCIIHVAYDLANNQDELDELYGKYLEDGYEGQMVRLLDSSYENKRSKNLLKRKEFIESDFEIVSVLEGLGNRSGMVGKMYVKMPDGTTFKTNVEGPFTYLTELFNERDTLIGKVCTLRYFKPTPDGIPRFAYLIAIRDYE